MAAGEAAENVLEGKVIAAMFMGDSKEVRVAIGDTVLRLKLHPATEIADGEVVRVSLPGERCRALPG